MEKKIKITKIRTWIWAFMLCLILILCIFAVGIVNNLHIESVNSATEGINQTDGINGGDTNVPAVNNENAIPYDPNEYMIRKINEISDKILNRYAVEDSYFIYIQDDELVNNIITYNSDTGDLTAG